MDELIIRSLMGETTAEEERQLIRWRAASTANDARYRSLSATWELAGHAWEPEPRDPPPARRIIERAEQEAREARARRGSESGPERPGVDGRWLAAAAVAAAALLGTAWWAAGRGAAGEAPYAIEAEAPRTVHLADGSAVHLAAGSTLEIDPNRPRRVRLEGRAYFGVAHQEGEPFVVTTDAGETRVLGTRFDITARDQDLTVIVVEGRVEVVSDSGEVEVGPGEQSRVADRGRPVVGRADLSVATEWLGPVFIFQDTPLSAVATELQVRFGRTISVDDAALRDRTVTAVFSHDSLEEILPALCRAVDAECVDTPEAVRFTL